MNAPLLTVDEAIRAVLERARALPARSVNLAAALGCILAEEVSADIDLPPFDKALMDGYAVRALDVARGETRLAVVDEITAGHTPNRAIESGQAAAIMTGAPLPPGADAVVMVERTRRKGASVVIDDPSIARGRNVLPRGREMRTGDVVLRRGDGLNPARLGVLAAVGRSHVSVIPRPRVAIVPTGDELVEPERIPGPGQIRNSNATMLAAVATQAGATAKAYPIAPDQPAVLLDALSQALAASDVVVVAGGVSAGKLHLVPRALDELGVEKVFHKVRVKPGKPVWYGIARARADGPGALVFGLPGNPVSGLVGFLLFVRPALAVLAGRTAEGEADPTITARLAREFTHVGDRPTYHPSRLIGGVPPAVEPLDWAGSADLRTMTAANGFAIFPPGDRQYAAGEIVRYLPFD